MTLDIYQVDAFTDRIFGGNPAAVCPLKEWLPSEVMQNIAAENNLAETAFFVPKGDGFHLRWFTPAIEVDFCGHATIGSSHVLFNHLNYPKSSIKFDAKVGQLEVRRDGDFYTMNAPTDNLQLIDHPPFLLLESLGVEAEEIYRGREDYVIVVKERSIVEQASPDFKALAKLGERGALITARDNEVDFVSRCFFPAAGIDEDPVTGSAHTTLCAYWSKKLSKNQLTARQISKRGGFIRCHQMGERVEISGQAKTFLIGTIYL